MLYYKTVGNSKIKAPTFVKINGRMLAPDSKWLADHGYVLEHDELQTYLGFTYSNDVVFTDDDAEETILQNMYNRNNSVVVQRTLQYFNEDISLILCFWGEDNLRINAAVEALSINMQFTHPGEWIFIEALTSKDKCKFKDICKATSIKYKFIKIDDEQTKIFLKTALWNIGYSISTKQKLAFLDSDIVFCRFDWLKSASDELDSNDVISLHSKCYYAKLSFTGKDTNFDGYKSLDLSRGFTEKHNMNEIGHSGFSIGMTKQFFKDYFKQFDVIPSKCEDMLYWYKITGRKTKNIPYADVYQYRKIKEDLAIGYGSAVCCHIYHGLIAERNYEKRLSLCNFKYNGIGLLPYYQKCSIFKLAANKFKHQAKIDWSIFDKIYCIHYLPYPERLEHIKQELDYVGILDLPLFEFYYTVPNDLYNYALEDSTPDHPQYIYIGNVNLHINRLNLMILSLQFGHKRILVLEDDVTFKNDLTLLKETIDAFPLEYDIVNMDPYIVGQTEISKKLNKFYAEVDNLTYNCSCIAFTLKAIEHYVQAIGQSQLNSGILFPGDNVNEWSGENLKKCVCLENVCIQADFANRQNLFGDPKTKYTNIDISLYKEKKQHIQTKESLRFEIDITRECNWSCNSCNRLCNIKKENASSYMTLAEIKSIVWQIKNVSKQYNISKLKILGGEPTLHRQFREICYIVKDYLWDVVQNHNILVGTNGSNNSIYKDFIVNEMKFKIIGDDKTLPFKNIEHRNMLLSPTENRQQIAAAPCWIYHECGICAFKENGKVRWYWCGAGSLLATLIYKDKLEHNLHALLKQDKHDLLDVCRHCQCSAAKPIKYSDNSSISHVFDKGLEQYVRE